VQENDRIYRDNVANDILPSGNVSVGYQTYAQPFEIDYFGPLMVVPRLQDGSDGYTGVQRSFEYPGDPHFGLPAGSFAASDVPLPFEIDYYPNVL
jgi:hypothetical protein